MYLFNHAPICVRVYVYDDVCMCMCMMMCMRGYAAKVKDVEETYQVCLK